MTSAGFVRTPASSANLGAGFDVLGMALTLYADVGFGDAPDGAQQLDEHHLAWRAFAACGGTGPIWMRCSIPGARGLGFSGSVRVGGAALATVQRTGVDGGDAVHVGDAIAVAADEILRVTAELEGHGDNVAASLFGGVTAFVDGSAVSIPVGPTLAAAGFVAWIPDTTTSTNASRKALGPDVELVHAVHNIGRAIQFTAAFAHDDPSLLTGATDDRIHQAHRLPLVPDAAEALDTGIAAGAWCGWLSGSGPTVAFLCDSAVSAAVIDALPARGHTKVLTIDTDGTRWIDSTVTSGARHQM